MTEGNTPNAAPATVEERIASALERIAECMEGLVLGDEYLHIWVKHVSDAGEAENGSSLGYLKVVARDSP